MCSPSFRSNTARAREIATLAAARVDPVAHAALRAPDDESRPEYRDTAARLRLERDAHPEVRFITTIEVDDDRCFDHSRCRRGRRGDIGPWGSEVFADDELLETFAGAAPDVNVLYVDQWGCLGERPRRLARSRRRDHRRRRGRHPTGRAERHRDGGPAQRRGPGFGVHVPGSRGPAGAASFSSPPPTASSGLYNHRYLHERLAEELGGARDDGRPLSLLPSGLDQFKAFNKLHGHSAGDGALRAVARAIDDAIRQVDLAARYGGEEFAVILLGTDADAAAEVAERIRLEIAAAQMVPGKQAHLTVSIGLASYPADAAHKEELLDKAEWAMRLAKRRGRDRVVTFAADQQGDLPPEAGRDEVRGHPQAGAALLDADEALAELRRRAGGRLDSGLVQALLLALERERGDLSET